MINDALRTFVELVGHLTTLVVALIGLGIVGTLAFGSMGVTGLDPIANITTLGENLAGGGVVGLLVLAILLSLVK
jgi:hypothetical protein